MTGADRETASADRADDSGEDADVEEAKTQGRRAWSWRGLLPHARRWAVAVLGLVVVVVGWRTGLSWLYLLGVLATLIGAIRALRGRWMVQLAVVAAVAVVSLGGPSLGVRQAYAPVGVQVPWSVESYSQYVTTFDDATVFSQGRGLTAVGGDGSELWTSELSDLRYLWPMVDDRRVVAVLSDALVGVDDEGTQVWSRPAVWGDELIAAADGVVVLRSCLAQEGGPSSCTWTGVDVADGGTAWETSGTWAPGWAIGDGGYGDGIVRTRPTSLFTVRDESGTSEVREAATGDVTQTLADDGATPILVGEDLLLVQQSGECSIALVRGGAPEWTSVLDCALWREPTYDWDIPGVLVGDSLWAQPVEGVGTLVVDLRDGTVRTVGYSYWGGWYPYGDFGGDREPVQVLGAGVEAQVGPGGVVVRDPSNGDRLWSVAVRGGDIRSVQVSGEVLVLSRYVQPLLLHEWLAPEDPSRIAVEVYDPRSGELRESVRPTGDPGGPLLAGDRVVLDVGDLDGDVTLRMVGG